MSGYNYGGAPYAAPGYPVVTNATYANAAFQTAAAGRYGNNAAAGYGYNYNNPMQNYDASKSYYQQAATNYNTGPANVPNKTHYSAGPVRNIMAGPKGKQKFNAGGGGGAGGAQGNGGGNAGQFNKSNGHQAAANRNKSRFHYCEVCKISCAGPQTYREHLDGQKHKKREAAVKLQASAAAADATSQNKSGGGGAGGGANSNNHHCLLCDVTCTGNDAYAAHVRGSKHQRVLKLHQKLGKPIPPEEPKTVAKAVTKKANANNKEAAAGDNAGENDQGNDDDSNAMDEEKLHNIKPVGSEYIEEIKDDEGKLLSFNCKLCDCKFNDPNAKEMHSKGRKHRLQYKRKVQPDLVVDFKSSPRQRLAESQRALMQECGGMFMDNFRNMRGSQRGFGVRGGVAWPSKFFGMLPPAAGMLPRRPESSDDRHVVARHAEIYPKEEELQTIQRIVSHTERALKLMSDAFADNSTATKEPAKPETDKTEATTTIKDGRDNQMFTFQKDADDAGNVRILKGVMRVGLLAKGLLLQGDNTVDLVLLCAEKPTIGLLKRVAEMLPAKLKEVADDQQADAYTVEIALDDATIVVTDSIVNVRISLTSPLLRENTSNTAENDTDTVMQSNADNELLPREPCLQALAQLRQANWFQARATGLQSCVMIIRILRDLCQRMPSWQALSQWPLELLVEKVISSAGFPMTPGDSMRRIMEALAAGFLINGTGLLDPCEKEPHDAIETLSKQQREDLTVSAQNFVRYIAFRQTYKVLGMDQLPPLKFSSNSWHLNRKRHRSAGNAASGEHKTDADEKATEEKVTKIEQSDVAA